MVRSVAYEQGRRAFKIGSDAKINPYIHKSNKWQRKEWFNGFFDQWRWMRYGPNLGERFPSDIYEIESIE